MSGDQTIRFLVVNHQRLQKRRHAGGGGPVEADLLIGLYDPGPHDAPAPVRRHSMTRLLPESATANASPRSDSP